MWTEPYPTPDNSLELNSMELVLHAVMVSVSMAG